MIDFENAKILDYSHSHEFLGSLFRFGVRKNISIEGEVYNLGNFSGVSGIWSGIVGLIDSATDYDAIMLNGVNFGRGRVDSFSFEPGVDISRKSYRANLVVFDSGNLHNMSGAEYAGLSGIPVPYHLMESFSETFSLNLDDKKEGSLEQSISVKFVSGAAQGDSGNPIEYARILASGLRSYTSPLPFVLNLYPWLRVSDKQYTTELYNAITNDCQFDFTSEIRSGESSYGFSYTSYLNTDQEGFCSVGERGQIIGSSGNLYNSAVLGYNIESANAYSRCSSLYEDYDVSSPGSLGTTPIRSTRTNDHFAGTVSYEVEYSDSLRYNNGYSWSYSHDINKLEGCFYEVSENGEIQGIPTNCSGDRYALAESGWNIVQTGVSGRAYEYYNDATSLTKSLKLSTRSFSSNAIEGTIRYGNTFTDNQNYNISGYKVIDYTVENRLATHMANKMGVPGVGEIVQPAYISNPASRNLSLKVIGAKDKTIANYRDLFKSIANSLAPTGDDSHIIATNYSLEPLSNTFQGNCEWIWFASRAFGNVTV